MIDHRIDYYPTHEYQTFKFRRGRPLPFGATIVPNGVNFAIFSSADTSCTLVLFEKGATEPHVEIPFPEEFRIGNVFCMIVFDLDYEKLEYGYRLDGPFDPSQGHRFDKSKIICDPYAKVIDGRDTWLQPPNWDSVYPYRARLAFEDFDWEEDRPLEIPIEDLIIYELHTRSFTKRPSSNVKNPGTYLGLQQNIPYLKDLG